MASFCAQAFVAELDQLIQTLRLENHPALVRFEPFYEENYVREIQNCFSTLALLRQELVAIQCSIQNLTMLIVTQQPRHSAICQRSYRTHCPPPLRVPSISGLLPYPVVRPPPPSNVLATAMQQCDIPCVPEDHH